KSFEAGQKVTNDRLINLEAGQRSLEAGQKSLEVRQKSLEDGQKALDAKIDTVHEELSGQIGNIDSRTARISTDLKNFRKETGETLQGIFACLDVTDAEVASIHKKIAQ
ncbi:MAG: hypothetical protein RSA12_10660, partial [Clostridia bacterium]